MMGTYGPAILAVQYTVVPVGAVMVVLRLYARCLCHNTAGLDDLFITIAECLALFGLAITQIFVDFGIGQHIWDLQPNQISTAVKWLTIAELQNYCGLCLVRLSVGFLLLRFVPKLLPQHKLYRKIIITAMVANVMVTVTVIAVFYTQCIPLASIWHHGTKARCFAPQILNAINRLFACTSALIDFLFASLPTLVIRHIRLEQRTKTLLALCLSIGALTGGCAITKAAVINMASDDLTYQVSGVVICAIVELNIGIIAACFPSFREFILITYRDIKGSGLERPRSVSHTENSQGSASAITTNKTSSSILNSVQDANGLEGSIIKETSVTITHAPRAAECPVTARRDIEVQACGVFSAPVA